MDAIMQTNPVQYEYIDEFLNDLGKNCTPKKICGFIAQDIKKIKEFEYSTTYLKDFKI